MAKLNADTYAKLRKLAAGGFNVLLTGAHGIGKTTVFQQLCDDLGMRGCYISVPSSDYFVDWLGIPAPEVEPDQIRSLRWYVSHGADSLASSYAQTTMGVSREVADQTVMFLKQQAEQVSLRFLRPKRMEGVEFVFFDEINREADPRFLDACMELVQFRRVNGQPLPDLKLVWAAQNPPNSVYKVKELDIPLVDKFGAHVYLEANPDYQWYCSRGYTPHTVASVISWYDADLNKEQKLQVSPRCLENIMRLADSGMDVEECLLLSMSIPSHLLKAKLAKACTSHKYDKLDLASIAANAMQCIDFATNDLDFCAYYTDLVRKPESIPSAVLKTSSVFIAMPFEFQSKCYTDPVWLRRMLDYVNLRSTRVIPTDVATTPGFHNFVEMLRLSDTGL